MNTKPTPISLRSTASGATNFARAAFAVVQSRVTGREPEEIIQRHFSDAVAPFILQRSAVDLGGTSGWAAELATLAFGSFLDDLGPLSGASRLIAKGVKVRLGRASELQYPYRVDGPATPAWVTEAGAIPVRETQFALATVGPRRKLSHILVWSREVSKQTDAFNIFERMLREDVAAGVDAAFFATTAGSSSAHAGLLYGVTPQTGYAGDDRFAMETDLLGLANEVSTGGSGSITYIMRPESFAALKIKAPELATNLDIAVSTQLPAHRIVAADATALLVGIDDEPELLVADDAVVHMNDLPLPIGSEGQIADPARSLWQTASTGMRILHDIAFTKRRASAVAYLDNAGW